MNLCYSGISCSDNSQDANTPVIKTRNISFGKNYQRRRPIYQPLQETLNFVYRGIAYQTGETEDFSATKSYPEQTEPFIQKLKIELKI